MRFTPLLGALFFLPLTACVEQTLHKTVDNFTPNMSAFNPTTKEMHGLVLSMKSCSLSNRVIECQMTATSKFQDRTLTLIGGHYTKIQDDTGVSYPTAIAFGSNAKDKSQNSTLLIADTPYTFTLRAENISTQATSVRAIDITRMDLKGPSGFNYVKVAFPHPPMNAGMQTNQPATAPMVGSVSNTNQQYQPQGTADRSYQNLFATIVPINEHIPVELGIKALWGKGAYLFLNPNGNLGHNWSQPGTYAYVPGQTWKKTGNSLTISFGPNLTYRFDLSQKTEPLIAYVDQGGAFKMSIWPQ